MYSNRATRLIERDELIAELRADVLDSAKYVTRILTHLDSETSIPPMVRTDLLLAIGTLRNMMREERDFIAARMEFLSVRPVLVKGV